jgi:DNA-binding NarL/FixJ family response regulator
MSRTLAARLLAYLRSAITRESSVAPAPPPSAKLPRSLTQREQEVLDLIAFGARDREIAQKLNLTENTVKKHVKNILQKLGARNRAQAAAKAFMPEHISDRGGEDQVRAATPGDGPPSSRSGPKRRKRA